MVKHAPARPPKLKYSATSAGPSVVRINGFPFVKQLSSRTFFPTRFISRDWEARSHRRDLSQARGFTQRLVGGLIVISVQSLVKTIGGFIFFSDRTSYCLAEDVQFIIRTNQEPSEGTLHVIRIRTLALADSNNSVALREIYVAQGTYAKMHERVELFLASASFLF